MKAAEHFQFYPYITLILQSLGPTTAINKNNVQNKIKALTTYIKSQILDSTLQNRNFTLQSFRALGETQQTPSLSGHRQNQFYRLKANAHMSTSKYQ